MKEIKMYCIFHSRDLDGFMSAAIVKKALDIDGPIEFIGWDYGDPIPNLEPGRKVVMVDISFPMEEMHKLTLSSRNFIWIDHHKSAIQDYLNYSGGADLPFTAVYQKVIGASNDGDKITVSDVEKKAACELTWEYFFPNQSMPEIVRMLGSYDSFRHVGTVEEHIVFQYQYAARAYISNPEEAYQYLESDSTHHWINIGHAILNYETKNAHATYQHREEFALRDPAEMYSEAVDQVAMNKPPTVYKVAAVNAARMNPKTFSIDFHQDGYDLFMSYHYSAKSGLFTISIYSEKVDCSKIAKAFGGGGHAGAAGFQVKKGNNFLSNMIMEGRIENV